MPPHSSPIGPFPDGVDPDAYDRLRRRVLWSLPTGLYLLGSLHGEQRNLMTANWVTQVATAPKLVAVGVEIGAHSEKLIRAGGVFTLSLLAREDRAIVRKFVKPATDDRPARTLNGIAYRDAPVSRAPIPEAAIAALDCRVAHELDCGSHRLFVGEVLDASAPPGDGPFEVLRMEDTRMSYGG